MGVFLKFAFFLFAVVATSANSCCNPGEVLPYGSRKCKSLEFKNRTSASLKCSGGVMIVSKKDVNFSENEFGQLEFSLPNRIVTYDDYCQGLMESKNASLVHVAIICTSVEVRTIGEEVYGYSMLVSSVFLICTACWYATSPKLRDLLGKSIINLCVSLSFGFLMLFVMKIMPYSDMNWCAVRGFSVYFFVMVGFFWMNVISAQILFEGTHGQSLDKASERRHYAWYVLYAWGMPALLAASMAAVNFMPGDHLKPGIGLNHCWFFDTKQQWQYMYSVMSILIAINVIIFATVTVTMCGGATHESFRKKFATCVRLFVVMGIPWVFEMIGSLNDHHLFWEIMDLLNSLQGVWIFLVLVLLRPKDVEQKVQYMKNIAVTLVNGEPPYSKLTK